MEQFIFVAIVLAGLFVAIITRDETIYPLAFIIVSISVGLGISYALKQTFPLILLSLPCGLFLAQIAHDELKTGKKWFITVSIVSIVCSIIFLKQPAIAQSSLFVALVSMMSLLKAHGKV